MPLGSIPDTRTSPSRIAGAMLTIGCQVKEFLPAPVAPACRVPAAQGLVPVGAVLGAAGPDLAQVDVLAGQLPQPDQIRAHHGVGEQVAALEVDRHQIRGKLTHLTPGHPASDRERAGGFVELQIDVLAAQAPDLHEALEQVATEGWAYVIADGKVFRSDRCAETTQSAKGKTINAWYSGKHHAPGANVQGLIRPDGLPMWVSDELPGHRHDLACARAAGLLGAAYWAASQLDLPTLADSGYDGAGQGVHTPIKQPGDGQVLGPNNQAYNSLLRSTRCLGERGFALLTRRWRALRRITASPRRIGAYVKAALVLTHIEQLQLRTSC